MIKTSFSQGLEGFSRDAGLSNFNFQWTKILYQNNLKNIAFSLTFFKGWRCNKSSVVTPKKIIMGARENEISQNLNLNLGAGFRIKRF